MAPPRPAPAAAQTQPVHPAHKEKGRIPVLIISLLLVIAAGAALFFILSSGGKISVPEVIGQTQADARENIESAGLRFALGPDKDGPLPIGLVAEQ
ncbi:MAG: PASTA domain-containing protein, partial [candidate division WOR-3 bacterium]